MRNKLLILATLSLFSSVLSAGCLHKGNMSEKDDSAYNYWASFNDLFKGPKIASYKDMSEINDVYDNESLINSIEALSITCDGEYDIYINKDSACLRLYDWVAVNPPPGLKTDAQLPVTARQLAAAYPDWYIEYYGDNSSRRFRDFEYMPAYYVSLPDSMKRKIIHSIADICMSGNRWAERVDTLDSYIDYFENDNTLGCKIRIGDTVYSTDEWAILPRRDCYRFTFSQPYNDLLTIIGKIRDNYGLPEFFSDMNPSKSVFTILNSPATISWSDNRIDSLTIGIYEGQRHVADIRINPAMSSIDCLDLVMKNPPVAISNGNVSPLTFQALSASYFDYVTDNYDDANPGEGFKRFIEDFELHPISTSFISGTQRDILLTESGRILSGHDSMIVKSEEVTYPSADSGRSIIINAMKDSLSYVTDPLPASRRHGRLDYTFTPSFNRLVGMINVLLQNQSK